MWNFNPRNSKNCIQEIIEISHFGELARMHARIMEILVSFSSLHPETVMFLFGRNPNEKCCMGNFRESHDFF